MDRVKLGRALGYGTRHAAKTLAAVAEAATAPAPQRAETQNASGQTPGSRAAVGPDARPDMPEASGVVSGRQESIPVRRPSATQVRGAGRSVLAPLATFSSALWLRVTGCFFALVAFTMLSGAWRQRAALRAGADVVAVRHFWTFVAVGVVFGYFAVSSFVRANLRERRAASGGAR